MLVKQNSQKKTDLNLLIMERLLTQHAIPMSLPINTTRISEHSLLLGFNWLLLTYPG